MNPAIHHDLGQNIVGSRPERRPHIGTGFPSHLVEVFFNLFTGVAPSEIGVGLVETYLRQSAHHSGASKRLRQEQHFGMLVAELRQDFLPELYRLGVGIIHPENRYPMINPLLNHVAYRVIQTAIVLIKNQGINILIFLGRILCVGNRSIRAVLKPLGMILYPGMIRGALQRQIQRYL